MKRYKNIIIISLIIVVLISILIIYYIKFKNDKISSSNDTTTIIDENVNTDDDDEKIDWSIFDEIDYTLTESIVITKPGVYNLTGEISNGNIIVNSSGNVKLILNGVTITNNDGAAILIKNAEDVVIELADDSVNILEDGNKYDSDEIATIFSHCDLTLQGNGTLKIIANNEDGIVSTDDLKFNSGIYDITSNDDAIRGKDSVYIMNGTFNIKSSADGIKTTNDIDSDKGFIKIDNGTFEIDSMLDAIVAQSKLIINDGVFNIKTGTGSILTSSDKGWGNWSKSSSDASAKGLKSGSDLLINGGTFNLDTSDDSIHSNNYVGIKSGNITISSGDDGIHADESLIIDDGIINIEKSYEGLEAYKLTINNGTINIVSTDDGINVAGGLDSSSQNGRPGQNPMQSTGSSVLTINGGDILVNATGDGLDANGSIYINDGNVVVYGPVNDGNGTIDYDNVLQINGGTLLAGGSSGMLQSCSSSSSINSVTIVFNSTYNDGDIITITDLSDNEIFTFEGKKQFNSLVAASKLFTKGSSYKILINNETYESFTINSTVTTVGSVNNNMSMRGRR